MDENLGQMKIRLTREQKKSILEVYQTSTGIQLYEKLYAILGHQREWPDQMQITEIINRGLSPSPVRNKSFYEIMYRLKTDDKYIEPPSITAYKVSKKMKLYAMMPKF